MDELDEVEEVDDVDDGGAFEAGDAVRAGVRDGCAAVAVLGAAAAVVGDAW